ncbi:MAG: sulfite exporter TauE/SafE family protein [Bowdeniella nasicola]|nr:sulfite exporter TauE/SafE family protein [Bowdeniella nasicola]
MLTAGVIGVVIGVIVGALGAGGGILSVPVLVYVLHQDPHDAAAASLVIVGITALASLPLRARAGDVNWKEGAIFGGVSTIGALAGGWASRLVRPEVLLGTFALLLLVVGIFMVNRARATRQIENMSHLHTKHRDPKRASAAARSGGGIVLLVGAATITGLLTGFFGVGGGFAVVPMLVLVMSFAMKEASGTSLLVMIIAAAAGLGARWGADIHFDWPIIFAFTIGSAAGGIAGGPISQKARNSTLTLIFACLLIGVAIAVGLETIITAR